MSQQINIIQRVYRIESSHSETLYIYIYIFKYTFIIKYLYSKIIVKCDNLWIERHTFQFITMTKILNVYISKQILVCKQDLTTKWMSIFRLSRMWHFMINSAGVFRKAEDTTLPIRLVQTHNFSHVCLFISVSLCVSVFSSLVFICIFSFGYFECRFPLLLFCTFKSTKRIKPFI